MTKSTKKNRTLPRRWREVKIGEACKIITSPVDKKSVEGELSVKLCNYTDVYYNSTIDASIDYMIATAKSQEIEKFSLIAGDVVITKDSETPNDIGVPAYVKETIKNLLCGYHLAVLRPVEGVNGKYIHYTLNSQRISHDFYRFANGITRFGLTNESYQKIKIPLPPLPEQKAIASLLEKWDIAIEKTEALIAAKQKRFEWLVTSLINKSGYKKSKLLNFIEEVLKRNRNNGVNRVLSVTNRKGFVLPEEQFKRRVASVDISNYKVVTRGQYAYNPARINVGSIARLDDWDNGALSPMYTVFQLNTKKIESDYFLYWLSSDEAKQRIRNSAQGSVRKTVGFGDLGNIPITLPNLRIQKSITKTLNTAQQEMTLLKQLAEQYRIQKRGLMQKLLTGQWRLSA